MLSYLDCIIFPDRCEVIEVVPSQRYVYPIFKNASSSLYWQARQHNLKIKINEQIKKINNIDVLLRDPQERLISGLNTFVQHVIRDNPELDQTTVLWFAKKYLFLDRHYCPQLFWLINLFRYMSTNSTVTLKHVSDIEQYTQFHRKPPGILEVTKETVEQANSIPNIEMYQRLDQVLFNECINQPMTSEQVLIKLRQRDPQAYDWVIGRSQQILKSTYVLPKT